MSSTASNLMIQADQAPLTAKPRSAQAQINGADWRDSRLDFRYGLITDLKLLLQAATLEQDVWNEMSYGNLHEQGYGTHIDSSRTFAALQGQRCVGVNRMFSADRKRLLPFLESMPFHSESEKACLSEGAMKGEVEELGTVAVAPDARGTGVHTHLWRLAIRDALHREVLQWGIVMEPERVQLMNKFFGFAFRQLGPTIHYQGGACAAHVMDLDELVSVMRQRRPRWYQWFFIDETRPDCHYGAARFDLTCA